MSTVWWCLLVLFALATLGLIALAHRLRRGGAASELPCCGHCGYPLVGLPTTVCPECGTDSTVVGPSRATWWNRQLPQRRRALWLAVWTAWVGGAAALAWGPFDRYVQPGTVCAGDAVFLLPPASSACETAIARRWTIWRWGWQAQTPRGAGAEQAMWCVAVWPPSDTAPRYSDLLSKVGRGVVPATSENYVFAVDPGEAVITQFSAATGQLTVEDGAEWRSAVERWAEAVAEEVGDRTLPERLDQVLAGVLSAPPMRPQLAVTTSYASMSLQSPTERDWRFTGGAVALVVLVWLVGALWGWRARGARHGAGATPSAAGQTE